MAAGTSPQVPDGTCSTGSRGASCISQHSLNKEGASGGSSSDPRVTSRPDTIPEQHLIRRIAHYRVEKRYRTNINDKIRVLDEMLPKPSPVDQQQPDQSECGELNNRDGTSIKRSKVEVLSRVIDYISYLERKEDWQERKIRELNGRILASRQALESGHEVETFAR